MFPKCVVRTELDIMLYDVLEKSLNTYNHKLGYIWWNLSQWGEVLDHKTSFIPPRFIEGHVLNMNSEQSFICVLGISMCINRFCRCFFNFWIWFYNCSFWLKSPNKECKNETTSVSFLIILLFHCNSVVLSCIILHYIISTLNLSLFCHPI